MTRLEKKNFRKEVRDIKKEMKVAKGGLSISCRYHHSELLILLL